MGRTKPLRPGAQSRSVALQKLASNPSSPSLTSNGFPSTTFPTPPSPPLNIDESLKEVDKLLEECEAEKAKEVCRRLVRTAEGEREARVWEALAVVELELEEVNKAKKHFLKAIQLGAPNPSPSAHLYLAQFSSTAPEALQHFSSALSLLKVQLEGLCEARGGKVILGDGEEDEAGEWGREEKEVRRSCSRALVGMTECYLTDLCFDPEAESKCITFLSQAASLDPTDPEPLQTLASVRLSQSDPEAAREALRLSWSLWREGSAFDAEDEDGDGEKMTDATQEEGEEEDEEEEEEDGLPPFDTRLAFSKLAMECSLLPEAIQVLQGCEAQDDEDEECLYLLGVAWELLGEEKGTGGGLEGEGKGGDGVKRSAIGEGLSKEECWMEAREYLDACLKVHARSLELDPSGASSNLDDEVVKHMDELLAKLSGQGIAEPAVVVEEGEGGDEEWSDMEE